MDLQYMATADMRGFTLIELLIAMTVLAIVASVALPSFSSLMINNRSVALAEEFSGALQFARAEAVKRNKLVTICASSDGSSCGNDWSEGFIAVVDSAATESADDIDIDSAADVLRVWDNLGEGAVITSPADVSFVRYTSAGRLAKIGSPPFTFTTSVVGCEKGGGAKTFSISLAGSVSVMRSACP
jgi:type IV fimbrial biogenesis protein FimT